MISRPVPAPLRGQTGSKPAGPQPQEFSIAFVLLASLQ
jgi:hypothetical protein